MSYQLLLMVACTIFQGWHDYPLYGRLYCYNNVWADTLLKGGDEPPKVWGYLDVFTWEGYFMAWLFKIMFETLMDNIEGSIYAAIFAMFYVSNDAMVWCFPGEKM